MSWCAPIIVAVALGIDITRAFRFHDEILRLVGAVVVAAGTDESTWIEWKGTLDLSQDSAFWHLPRHVLGFANREPASAALNAEGYAYLIVGAEPGSVTGITPIDPGDLSAKLRAYVGERIGWHPQYVTVQGRDVLVIVVEPPRPGDSIHPLRKPMQSMQPGVILVRLPGQTVQARAEHIEMLEKRAKASANVVDLTVATWGAGRLEHAPDLEPLTAPLIEEMRARLLAKQSANAAGSSGEDVRLSVAFTEALGRAIAGRGTAYAEDVEVYLNEWARAVRRRRDVLFERHAPSHLKLTVKNNTDRNFRAVQVNVFLPGARSLDPDDQRWPRLPKEPEAPALQSARPAPLFSLFAHDPQTFTPGPFPSDLFASAALRVVQPLAPQKRLRRSQGPGGLLLEYPEIDLRPRQELMLQSVCIEVLDPGAETVLVEWDVTATNADGKLAGQISLPVTASTLRLAGIEAADAQEPD